MEQALQTCSNLKKEPLIYKYELANCFCMKLEWARAAEQYTPLINEEKFQVRALTALQLSACYVMLGDRAKAIQILNKIESLISKKAHFDPVVGRQAKRYLSNGGNFSAFELLYLRRDLAKMTPLIAQVLAKLDEVALGTKSIERKEVPTTAVSKPTGRLGRLGSIGSNLGAKLIGKRQDKPQDYSFDDRASYLLIKGSILKSIDRNEEAIVYFREAIELEPVLIEKLYVPYCLYELGESLYMQNKAADALEMMKRCSKYSGYDWEDPLKIRLRVTMDQLKKGTAPAPPQKVSLDSLEVPDSPTINEKEPSLEEDADEEELEQKLKIQDDEDL